MQFSAKDKTLTYDITGNGADTIIFVPALGATREMWRAQVTAFASDYTVVTYDAAGHDPATVSNNASLAGYAADLLALADAVHARRPHIVGLSLGGMIAQEYGARYPDRAKSLVLACTTSSYPQEQRDQFEQRAATAERLGMEPIVETTIQRWLTAPFIERDPETVAWVRRMLASADPRAYAQAARAAGAVNTTNALPRIGAPVLVLSGEYDASMPPGATTTLVSHSRNARSRVIVDAAHLANVEQPDLFNETVFEFTRGIDGAPPGEAGVPGLPLHGSEAPAPRPGEGTDS